MRWEEESLNLHFYWLKGPFNLPHDIGMVWEELAFNDALSYKQQGKWIAAQLNVLAVAINATSITKVDYDNQFNIFISGEKKMPDSQKASNYVNFNLDK